MPVQVRHLFLQPAHLPGQIPDLIGFRQTQIQFSAGELVQGDELGGDAVRHADEILRPVPQQDALLRQPDGKGLTGKQFLSQFLLQGPQRLRQRGLRHVQDLGGPGHVLLPCHRQKISQSPDLHGDSS